MSSETWIPMRCQAGRGRRDESLVMNGETVVTSGEVHPKQDTNMPQARYRQPLSPEEYLEGELASERKHEFIDGELYAVAGASINHERIVTNWLRKLGNHLETSPCEPLGSDMKVKVGTDFYYPDVIVDCEFDESTPYFTEIPKIIVEVLSRSTRRTDETIKRMAYMHIATLQEYVLIEQDFVDVEVVRRSKGWQSRHYFMGDEVLLESIGLKLPVQEIYHRVNNEDVKDYLAQLEAERNAEDGETL